MTITSLKNKLEQLELFDTDIFEFLFDSRIMKSWDNDELKKFLHNL